MKKGCWEDQEVVDLFNQVEFQKESNKPLKEAFKNHAEKYRRKPNSVRNYYYYQLEQLKNDITKTKRLGIDLSLHEKIEIEYFSKDEEDRLISKIDKLVKSGQSIRKACYQLSGGDLNLMLRYQNKYRNHIAKAQSKTKVMPDNIISFSCKKKASLTDGDINSLFLGLVRLVKRSAIEEYTQNMKDTQNSANEMLRKTIIDLNKKNKELSDLKESLVKLKLENSRLVQDMMKLKCQKADKLTKLNKEGNLF